MMTQRVFRELWFGKMTHSSVERMHIAFVVKTEQRAPPCRKMKSGSETKCKKIIFILVEYSASPHLPRFSHQCGGGFGSLAASVLPLALPSAKEVLLTALISIGIKLFKQSFPVKGNIPRKRKTPNPGTSQLTVIQKKNVLGEGQKNSMSVE